MGGNGRPRELRIPLWVPLVPLLALGTGALGLWGLWHSPWSPERLQARLESLRQENLRLESQRDRAEEGLQRASAALEGLEKSRPELGELGAFSSGTDSVATERDGFLRGWFGARRRDEPADVAQLLGQAGRMRQELDHLLEALERQPALAARLPTIRPVRADAPMVQPFVRERDPFTGLTMHTQGVAWGVAVGTPVWATGAGEVIDVTTLARWGRTVEVDHGSGIRTLYCHLSQATVKIGDRVMRGQVVGLSGESGTTLGPRVFYAVFQGRKARSPWEFILPEPLTDSVSEPDALSGTLWRGNEAVGEPSERSGQDQTDAGGLQKRPKPPADEGAHAEVSRAPKEGRPPGRAAAGTRPEQVDRLEGKPAKSKEKRRSSGDPETGAPGQGRIEPPPPREGEAGQGLKAEEIESAQ